jgi:RNA polymerase sigma-70 factor (ECF subfamily)
LNRKEKNIDSELIKRLNKDDHESFRKLFERYSKPLFQFSFKYLKSKEAAEDIVQEVFLKIWDKRKEIKSDTSFKSYLFTIVLNAIRKNFNNLSKLNDLKHNILIESSDNITSISESDEYAFLLKQMEDLISEMPEKRREVFIKKKIEEKSLKEIAEELDITTKTVEYHITEAMKFLKKEFKKFKISGFIFFLLFVQ